MFIEAESISIPYKVLDQKSGVEDNLFNNSAADGLNIGSLYKSSLRIQSNGAWIVEGILISKEGS